MNHYIFIQGKNSAGRISRLMLTCAVALVLLTGHGIQHVYGLQLPDVYLDPNDPIFNETLCSRKSKTIYAREGDTMNVICLNRDLNNAVRNENFLPSGYAFNLLVTTDHGLFQRRQKQSTDGRRKANTIHVCRQYQQLADKKHGFFREAVDKYHIQFSRWGMEGRPRFEGGKVYYFYTTSDGTKQGLENKVGPTSTKHMYFKLVVCKAGKRCDERTRVNRCVRKDKGQKQISSTKQKMEPDWLLFGTMAGASFLAGFLIASFINAVRSCRKEMKLDAEKDSQDSSTTESPEHSELLKK